MIARTISLRGRMAFALVVGVLLSLPALAAAPQVATVPWNPAAGIYTNAHATYDGYNMLLMGVASDADGDIASYEWDFGDGNLSGVIAVAPTGGPLDIEIRHVYNGVNNQPFTAKLTVCDAANDCTTDNFPVVVKTQTLDIDVNISIDEGLWKLHKDQAVVADIAGQPAGRWNYSNFYFAAATSSSVQAFLINEHLPSGDPSENPYIDTVVRGINYMLSTLTRVGTAAGQTCVADGPFDPDSNGNSYSLGVNSGRPTYETGQVMDALAATRTPAAVAVTGIPEVLGRTYKDIATDMADYYAYCMSDSGSRQGGWYYSCNSTSADNSISQWAAIGFLGVDQAFGVPTPSCVKSQNELWTTASRFADGRYSYYPGQCIDGCESTTSAGMTELAMSDIPTTDARWVGSEKWICDNWTTGQNIRNSGNMYAYYAVAKGQRSAVGGTDDMIGDDASNPCASPVNWYGSLASRLTTTQNADGSWPGGSWVSGDLATAWAIIILKPTLVCPAPVADCDADPTSTTTTCPVAFDGSGSTHPGASAPQPGCGTTIVSYDWDYDDGNTDSGDMVSHTFGAVGTYNVELTVTDDVGIASTTVCPIDVVPAPVAPDADPNGPYQLCLDIPGSSVILDGEGSLDPDNAPCVPGNGIVGCAWELDFAEFPADFDDAVGCTVDATAFYTGLGAGTYNVGLRVTDDEGATDDDFTTVFVGQCIPDCGNGILNLGEDCDDGNNDDGDGCSALCQFEGACCSDGPGIESECFVASRYNCESSGVSNPGIAPLYLGDGTECTSDIDCVGLAVTLESMSAEGTPNGVMVRWTTLTEVETVGFRVLRETADRGEKSIEVAIAMVPAAGDGARGASYQFLDTAKPAFRAVRYILEDIDVYGKVTRHDAVDVVRHPATRRTASRRVTPTDTDPLQSDWLTGEILYIKAPVDYVSDDPRVRVAPEAPEKPGLTREEAYGPDAAKGESESPADSSAKEVRPKQAP